MQTQILENKIIVRLEFNKKCEHKIHMKLYGVYITFSGKSSRKLKQKLNKNAKKCFWETDTKTYNPKTYMPFFFQNPDSGGQIVFKILDPSKNNVNF